jgi:hypothetical protein
MDNRTEEIEQVWERGWKEMIRGKTTVFSVGFITFGLLCAAITAQAAHGYIGKTVKTSHGIYHKGYTHTRHGLGSGIWDIPKLHAGVTSHIIVKITWVINFDLKRVVTLEFFPMAKRFVSCCCR